MSFLPTQSNFLMWLFSLPVAKVPLLKPLSWQQCLSDNSNTTPSSVHISVRRSLLLNLEVSHLSPISILTDNLDQWFPKYGCYLQHLRSFEIMQILKYISHLTPRPIKLESLELMVHRYIFLKFLHALSGLKMLLWILESQADTDPLCINSEGKTEVKCSFSCHSF